MSRWTKLYAQRRKERRAILAAERKREREGKKLYPHYSERPLPIPAEVLAERERRLSLGHRDLTAFIFGDPLPGYSALERRA